MISINARLTSWLADCSLWQKLKHRNILRYCENYKY